jgi:hypothetical protein
MKVRRTILDAAQGKSFDRSVGRLVQGSFYVQVMHLLVEVERCEVTTCALRLAKEQSFTSPFGDRCLRRIETTGDV